MQISIEQFQTECLKLVDDIQKYHNEITITKFGRPIVKLVPILDEQLETPLLAFMKDSILIHEDIIASIEEEWEVDEKKSRLPGTFHGDPADRIIVATVMQLA